MQIKSIGMDFGATIANTAASKKLQTVIQNSAKNDDFILKHKTYKDLCKQINNFLPQKSDKVIFEQCDNNYGNGWNYSVSGTIIHNKEQKPFYTRISPSIGSNIVVKNIISALERSLNNSSV